MKQVSESVISRITDTHRVRLARIDAEDYGLIAEKVREDLARDGVIASNVYLERGIYALKQYYAVAMLDPANVHAIASPIDPFWHAHILFTSQYRAFCDAVVGEYMDHVPLNRKSSAEVANVRQLYQYTLDVLPILFGEIDKEFWPAGVEDSHLICYHKGNEGTYLDLQKGRLFEPSPRGHAWAYAK